MALTEMRIEKQRIVVYSRSDMLLSDLTHEITGAVLFHVACDPSGVPSNVREKFNKHSNIYFFEYRSRTEVVEVVETPCESGRLAELGDRRQSNGVVALSTELAGYRFDRLREFRLIVAHVMCGRRQAGEY